MELRQDNAVDVLWGVAGQELLSTRFEVLVQTVKFVQQSFGVLVDFLHKVTKGSKQIGSSCFGFGVIASKTRVGMGTVDIFNNFVGMRNRNVWTMF